MNSMHKAPAISTVPHNNSPSTSPFPLGEKVAGYSKESSRGNYSYRAAMRRTMRSRIRRKGTAKAVEPRRRCRHGLPQLIMDLRKMLRLQVPNLLGVVGQCPGFWPAWRVHNDKNLRDGTHPYRGTVCPMWPLFLKQLFGRRLTCQRPRNVEALAQDKGDASERIVFERFLLGLQGVKRGHPFRVVVGPHF